MALNRQSQEILKKWGLLFLGAYLFGFVLLVTFFSKYNFNTFPGDILIQRESFRLYLPFTSSLAIATFTIVLFEVFKNFR